MLFGALALAAALPCLALAREWPVIVSALALLFLGCSLSEAAFAGPVVGVARLIAGESVVAALLLAKLSAREGSQEARADRLDLRDADEGRLSRHNSSEEVFQFMLVVLALVAAFAMSQVAPLGMESATGAGAISFFVYWMAMSGLLVLLHSHTPLRVGAGIVLLLSAGNLLYAALGSPGIATLMAGAVLYLAVGLAVSRAEVRA